MGFFSLSLYVIPCPEVFLRRDIAYGRGEIEASRGALRERGAARECACSSKEEASALGDCISFTLARNEVGE